jgi:hypothetical protein
MPSRERPRSRRAAALRLVGAWLFILGSAAPSRGEVIERILAAVHGRPLLLSEVIVLQQVRGLDRREALEAAIDARLMYEEAARVPQSSLSPDEEKKAYESLLERAGIRTAGLLEADLKELARREATILKYVEFRFVPQVRVDADAVRRAYETEIEGQPSPPPLEESGPALKQRLIDRDLDAKIEAWVKELRSTAEVRYNAPS